MQRLLLLSLLLLSACVSAPNRVETAPTSVPTPITPSQARCIDCGVVQDIRSVTATAQSNTAKKPVLSGIVGTVVSKSSAAKPTSRYEILIQMLNGKKIVVTQSLLSSGLKIGSKVRVSQGRILAVGP